MNQQLFQLYYDPPLLIDLLIEFHIDNKIMDWLMYSCLLVIQPTNLYHFSNLCFEIQLKLIPYNLFLFLKLFEIYNDYDFVKDDYFMPVETELKYFLKNKKFSNWLKKDINTVIKDDEPLEDNKLVEGNILVKYSNYKINYGLSKFPSTFEVCPKVMEGVKNVAGQSPVEQRRFHEDTAVRKIT